MGCCDSRAPFPLSWPPGSHGGDLTILSFVAGSGHVNANRFSIVRPTLTHSSYVSPSLDRVPVAIGTSHQWTA